MTEPAPAFYALRSGGARDYVTLLHPPYTAWHLSYAVVGGCLVAAVEATTGVTPVSIGRTLTRLSSGMHCNRGTKAAHSVKRC